MAVKTDGILWAWGNNGSGQLGDGTTTDHASPVQVKTDTDWAAVAAGDVHTVAVKTDGTPRAWGNNNFGQLGTAPPTSAPAPSRSDLATGGSRCLQAIATRWQPLLPSQPQPSLAPPPGLPVRYPELAPWAINERAQLPTPPRHRATTGTRGPGCVACIAGSEGLAADWQPTPATPEAFSGRP